MRITGHQKAKRDKKQGGSRSPMSVSSGNRWMVDFSWPECDPLCVSQWAVRRDENVRVRPEKGGMGKRVVDGAVIDEGREDFVCVRRFSNV